MSVRDSFVNTFGEDTAVAIESAAETHKNGIHDNPGNDSFQWALVICIGYECFTEPAYAVYHGLNPEAGPAIKQWIKDNGELDSYTGDVNYLSLFGGYYNEYMPERSEANV